MQQYRYIAYNKAGVKQAGSLTAENEAEARQHIQNEKLLLVELKLDKSSGLAFNQQLTTQDLAFFTTELALLLKSGLTIERGLVILQHNVQKPLLLQLITQVLTKIRQGTKLSEALTDLQAFSPLYLALVKIAEETGELAKTFDRLAADYAYQIELQSKIKQAMLYPTIILSVCILALVFIFNYIVPNLSAMFTAEQQLPGYTQALLAVSEFFQHYQLYLLVIILVGAGLLWHHRQHPQLVNALQQLKEHLPGFKGANQLVESIRFNSAVASMLVSGVSIDRALILAKQTLKTRSIQFEIGSALEEINRGQGLAKSLSETSLYPPYYAALLAIGEESGELARVFEEITERSRKRFYDWVTRFTTLLEPLLILFMGIIVGSVVVVMMLSITAVTDFSI